LIAAVKDEHQNNVVVSTQKQVFKVIDLENSTVAFVFTLGDMLGSQGLKIYLPSDHKADLRTMLVFHKDMLEKISGKVACQSMSEKEWIVKDVVKDTIIFRLYPENEIDFRFNSKLKLFRFIISDSERGSNNLSQKTFTGKRKRGQFGDADDNGNRPKRRKITKCFKK